MRNGHVAAGTALLLFLFLASYAHSQSASMNASINSTTAYIEQVNESSYLVYYPNLTTAYSDLGKAINASKTNETEAAALLVQARQSAQAAQARVEAHKPSSFAILVGIGIIVAALLYMFMRPVRDRQRRSNG